MATHKWIGLGVGILTAIFGALQSLDLTPVLGMGANGVILAVIGAANMVLHSIPAKAPAP